MSIERQQAIGIVADTMGELVAFWGFKASMGRIWTTLYLSNDALSADVIAERTGLSAGATSMALQEMMNWGIVRRRPMPNARKRHYEAETDVFGMVRRIVRDRELRLIERAVHNFDIALCQLEALHNKEPDDEETAIAITRLRSLLDLANLGYRLIETLADVGQLSLVPIRGALRAFGVRS